MSNERPFPNSKGVNNNLAEVKNTLPSLPKYVCTRVYKKDNVPVVDLVSKRNKTQQIGVPVTTVEQKIRDNQIIVEGYNPYKGTFTPVNYTMNVAVELTSKIQDALATAIQASVYSQIIVTQLYTKKKVGLIPYTMTENKNSKTKFTLDAVSYEYYNPQLKQLQRENQVPVDVFKDNLNRYPDARCINYSISDTGRLVPRERNFMEWCDANNWEYSLYAYNQWLLHLLRENKVIPQIVEKASAFSQSPTQKRIPARPISTDMNNPATVAALENRRQIIQKILNENVCLILHSKANDYSKITSEIATTNMANLIKIGYDITTFATHFLCNAASDLATMDARFKAQGDTEQEYTKKEYRDSKIRVMSCNLRGRYEQTKSTKIDFDEKNSDLAYDYSTSVYTIYMDDIFEIITLGYVKGAQNDWDETIIHKNKAPESGRPNNINFPLVRQVKKYLDELVATNKITSIDDFGSALRSKAVKQKIFNLVCKNYGVEPSVLHQKTIEWFGNQFDYAANYYKTINNATK